MSLIIGIRREDKNQWERRVPLIPADIINLQETHRLRFRVQPSAIRVYTDDEFRAFVAGWGFTSSKDITKAKYEAMRKALEAPDASNETGI